MKRIITIMFLASAVDPAFAAPTVAARLAAAKAACPNCYRVINTNGVFVGMNRADYEAYEASRVKKAGHRPAAGRHTPRKHPLSGRGPMSLRRGYIPPAKQDAR